VWADKRDRLESTEEKPNSSRARYSRRTIRRETSLFPCRVSVASIARATPNPSLLRAVDLNQSWPPENLHRSPAPRCRDRIAATGPVCNSTYGSATNTSLIRFCPRHGQKNATRTHKHHRQDDRARLACVMAPPAAASILKTAARECIRTGVIGRTQGSRRPGRDHLIADPVEEGEVTGVAPAEELGRRRA